ncbi:prophage antirepressor-like protein [Inquilinus ginsengisoli]|uniref:BRO-N domain-containing protein n=1 Tax=Inquilinus ginsengisoli TaxID=363840 RepID=UPI003D1B0EFF
MAVFDFTRGTTTQRIRTVTIDGAPWFAAIDVCRAIGLLVDKRGTFHHLVRLNPREKRPATPVLKKGMPGQPATLISESGLYKLILRSQRSPTAKPFQDWVTREVLPTIRREGAYTTPGSFGGKEDARPMITLAPAPSETDRERQNAATCQRLNDAAEYELILRAIAALQGRVERLKAENESLHDRMQRALAILAG